jgi:hypothetical protein
VRPRQRLGVHGSELRCSDCCSHTIDTQIDSSKYAWGQLIHVILGLVRLRDCRHSIYLPISTCKSGYKTSQTIYICVSQKHQVHAVISVRLHQFAPKALSAMRSSFTAVAASSKFRAEMAHLACFVASAIERSSSLKGPWEGAGAGADGWA